MEQLVYITLFLLMSVHGTLLVASMFRFRNWALTYEEDVLLGVPVFLIFLSFLGSLVTVGLFGMVSILAPLLLAVIAWRGRVVFQKPSLHAEWHGIAFASTGIFFLLKFWSLYNFNSGEFYCTHHDDYSYLQQINLLFSQKKESHFTELIRNAFGLSAQYKVYHLVEFYIILFFKTLFGNTSYNWFHFFLKPFLNGLSVVVTVAFFRNRYANSIRFFLLFFSFSQPCDLIFWMNLLESIILLPFGKVFFFKITIFQVLFLIMFPTRFLLHFCL